MSAVIADTELTPTERNKRLLKEAYALSGELAAMDLKIDAEVRRIHGSFAVDMEKFFAENTNAKFVADQASGQAIERSIQYGFKRIALLLKLGVKEIPGLGIVLDLLSSEHQPSFRAAYLDSPSDPALLTYEAKKARLAQILAELWGPPSLAAPVELNFKDLCAHEACWRSR